MKFLTQPVKDFLSNITNKTKRIGGITLPFLKKIAKEKLYIPVVRRQINKGLFFVFSFVGIHCLEFFVTHYFMEKAITSEQGSSIENAAESPERFNVFFTTLANMLITTALFSMRRALVFHLRTSLERSLKDKMLEDWLSNNAATGIEYLLEAEGSDMQPVNVIFSEHVSTFSRESVSITVTSLSDMISIIINLYYLGKLFNPNLVIFSILYGVVNGTVSYKIFSKSWGDLSSEVSKQESAINTRIINIQKFGAQTVSFRAEKLELERLTESFRNRESLAKQGLMLEIKGALFERGLSYGSLMYLIFPEMHVALFINRHKAALFNQVVNAVINGMSRIIFSSTQDLPRLEESIKQIEKFQDLMKKWNDFNDLKLLRQTYNAESKIFSIRKLRVHIPDKKSGDTIGKVKKILSERPNLLGRNNRGVAQRVDIEFQKGKIYLFTDASGTGKTTFLKSILGMFPFASGNVIFPCRPEQVRYVSRNTFLPTKGTLLEAITYPKIPTKSDASKVKKYIEKIFGVIQGEKHKKQLNDTADWSSKLSDGEKQRFAMIGVLLSKPEVLILDEALGNLDKPSKSNVEEIIRDSLPNSVILYADHHPIPGFADYIVNLKGGKLSWREADKEIQVSASYRASR